MRPREVLKSLPFFGGVLDDAQIEALANGVLAREFPKKAVLMRQGELGGSMFVLTEGKVEVAVRERDGNKRVATLGPGDIVGEMSLLTGARRSATVTALKAVRALEVTKAALGSVLFGSPSLIRRFAEVMEQRHAELESLHGEAARWNATGMGRNEIAAMMTAYYVG